MRNSDAKKREKRQSEGSYRRVGQERRTECGFLTLHHKTTLIKSMHLDVPMFQKHQKNGGEKPLSETVM